MTPFVEMTENQRQWLKGKGGTGLDVVLCDWGFDRHHVTTGYINALYNFVTFTVMKDSKNSTLEPPILIDNWETST